MVNSEGVNFFPFSIYPKELPAGSSIKIALLEATFLCDTEWSLFYVGSTPSGMPSKSKTSFKRMSLQYGRKAKTMKVLCAVDGPLPRKQENNVFRLGRQNEVTVCSKAVVGGETFNTAFMLSSMGGLGFSRIEDLNLSFVDSWKCQFSEGKVS